MSASVIRQRTATASNCDDRHVSVRTDRRLLETRTAISEIIYTACCQQPGIHRLLGDHRCVAMAHEPTVTLVDWTPASMPCQLYNITVNVTGLLGIQSVR